MDGEGSHREREITGKHEIDTSKKKLPFSSVYPKEKLKKL
jgi:hypothetical protein